MSNYEDLALLIRTENESARLDDFNDIEQLKLITLQRAFFRRAEAQFFRYRTGFLDEEAWQTVRGRVWANSQIGADNEIWQRDKGRIYTKGFVDEVESYQPPEED